MLKNIKSSYFIQILFAYLDDKQKLKIVKYNKNLQKMIYINIINYYRFSGRYIIYESNGIGKEYDGETDKLIYEGEYLNGEKNGRGKEYDIFKDYLVFESEYKNGKRNGKGKEYDYYGNLRFEGEYLNNKEWIGEKYDIYGTIKYKLNNDINGKGKEYFDFDNGQLIFEGEYLNGKRNGKGKEYGYSGKLKFEGEYKNDLRWNGIGYAPSNNIVYKLKDGKALIKEYWSGDIIEFECEYLNGKANGKGKKYMYDGTLEFECEYLNGRRNGKGKEYYDDGKLKFEGEYLYNHKLNGKLYIKEKLEYEGEFLCNKKWNGKGYDEYGNIIYELINGNGKVKEYDSLGRLSFEGEYLNGKRNGRGKEYNFDGYLKYEGEYLNGKRLIEKGEEYDVF